MQDDSSVRGIGRAQRHKNLAVKGVSPFPEPAPSLPVAPVAADFHPVPPTKDELKAQYRKRTFSKAAYDAELTKNRRAAIAEILQEGVAAKILVKDKALLAKFEEGQNDRGR